MQTQMSSHYTYIIIDNPSRLFQPTTVGVKMQRDQVVTTHMWHVYVRDERYAGGYYYYDYEAININRNWIGRSKYEHTRDINSIRAIVYIHIYTSPPGTNLYWKNSVNARYYINPRPKYAQISKVTYVLWNVTHSNLSRFL